MLYPRQLKNGKLVQDNQMVEYKEHMTQQHRLLFLTGIIGADYDSLNLLLALDTLSHEPIKLIITSPGGDLDATFLFYDAMKLIKSPIWTAGRFCLSAAAILLAAGSKRYLFPHAKTMLHLPSNYFQKDTIIPFQEMEIQQMQAKQYKRKMMDILCECGAKKSPQEILIDIDRDFWLEPKEAIEYGLADEILDKETWLKWIS